MPARASMVMCRAPKARRWQLGALPPARGHIALLGWHIEPPHVDAGVHPPIDRILANVLTGCARLTFLWSEHESEAVSSDDVIYRTDGAAGLSRLGARLAGQPSRFTLLTTRHPDTAVRMFDVTGFDWSQQGQVGLMSDPDAPPPVIDYATIGDLFSADWVARAAGFNEGPIRGVLRPGVDGDVAGLYSSDPAFMDRIQRDLEAACRDAGCDWALVPDDQSFADRLTAA